MDLHVWYWYNNQNYVATRYYHSEFIGKASTKDVFNSFSACVSGVNESKLLQVSSDDPNVTGYFLTFLRKTGMIKYWDNLFILEHVVYVLRTFLWNIVEKHLIGILKSCYHPCTEYLMSHYLEELVMRHLNKQYLQTTQCSSVHIVWSKTRE